MINVKGKTINMRHYPSGEYLLEMDDVDDANGDRSEVDVLWEFESMDEVFELLLISKMYQIKRLSIPYFPFARDDKPERHQSPTLKTMCDLINQTNSLDVVLSDPHSEVVMALLNNARSHKQSFTFSVCFEGKVDFYLISPDGGALKKIYDLAKIVDPLDVIECSKKRNLETGDITKIIVHCDDLKGKDCYIVDDICDGGRTFIEIAKILKKRNAGKIILMVTHGLFTKGMDVFDGLIDEIYTRKGQAK